MNIAITGPMGSGKTSVGRQIAKKLNLKFIDSDSLIVHQTEYSISDYFNQFGEQEFRKKEEQVISEISRKNGFVIATGGGVVLSPRNMRSLRRNGVIINLYASIETLNNRLQYSKKKRPLLQSTNIKEALIRYSEGRSHQYSNADFRINTNFLTIKEVVTKIIDLLNLPRVRICACIAGDNPVDQLSRALVQGASLVELRMDLLKYPNIESLIQCSGLPVIATDRKNPENLIQAIKAGCDYIDIDLSNNVKKQLIKQARMNNCKVIISLHDYEKTPSSLTLDNNEGDFLKIATTINSAKDSVQLLSLLNQRGNLIVVGMGEKGLYTRIVAPLMGSFLTYAYVEKTTAPGQLNVEDMVEIYKKMGVK